MLVNNDSLLFNYSTCFCHSLAAADRLIHIISNNRELGHSQDFAVDSKVIESGKDGRLTVGSSGKPTRNER